MITEHKIAINFRREIISNNSWNHSKRTKTIKSIQLKIRKIPDIFGIAVKSEVYYAI